MDSGLTWHSHRPTVPTLGDCYYDTAYATSYIWQGTSWVIFSNDPIPRPPFTIPTKEQLEKHPSLKAAWEDFLVIKRLLGV